MARPWLTSYDPHVPFELDPPVQPLHYSLQAAALRFPSATAIIFEDTRMSYQQLDELTGRFAAALRWLGIAKGDRLAIWTLNCPQFVISYYGTLRAGAIAVPVNPLYAPPEVERQLRDCGARAIVAMSSHAAILAEIKARTDLEHIILTDPNDFRQSGHEPGTATRDGAALDLQSLLARAPSETHPIDVRPEDTACLLYTGGTTGLPKGAELTHVNLVADTAMCRAWLHFMRDGNEGVVTALPLYHSYGMTLCMNLAIAAGAFQLLIPNPRDITGLLEQITRHRPTVFPGVPTMYLALNNHPAVGQYDLSSIRVCISGAAPLPRSVQERFQALTGAHLVEGYGLTEASPVTHINPILHDRIGTIGVPVPGTDARIVDLNTGTTELSPGEAGELVVRGPQVMKGYWQRPEETAQQIRDGWLYTGDIARMDSDGYFTLVDRKKDMIIASGMSIYPSEVEAALSLHPSVQEAVVVGVPDAYRGETVKAFVVLRPGTSASAEELREFCRQQIARYKVPTEIEFRTELPRTAVGKVLRRLLVAAPGPDART